MLLLEVSYGVDEDEPNLAPNFPASGKRYLFNETVVLTHSQAPLVCIRGSFAPFCTAVLSFFFSTKDGLRLSVAGFG